MATPNPLAPLRRLVIEASSQLAISKRQGQINQPRVIFTAWTESDASTISDGPSGSINPVALQITTNPITEYAVPQFKVSGTCTYPQTLPRGPGEYRLVGCPKGATDKACIISSEVWQEILPPKNPPQDEIKSFTAAAFTVPAQFTDKVCPMPFRLAGDFEWKIVHEATKQEIVGTTSTRLEFVWLRGPALVSANTIGGSFLRTGVDLAGSYPVDLLRLFLPSPVELGEASKYAGDFRDWWLKHINSRLRATKMAYNLFSGKSSFGTGCCGGSFTWSRFARLVPFDGTPTLETCLVNSFDVAALTQLGCALLVDAENTELLDTNWICKSPFGKVQPSMPFGITDQTIPGAPCPPGINNPWFVITDGARAFETEVDKMQPIHARAWLEVPFLEDYEKVVDLAWAILVPNQQICQPELRTHKRDEYGSSHIFGTFPPENLSSYIDGGAFADAHCFSNNEFGKISKDGPDIARIGVYNTRGIPRPHIKHAAFVPVPPSLRKQIDKIISTGCNNQVIQPVYNDASLKLSSIEHLLLKETPLKLQADVFEIKTTVDATLISLTFTDMPATAAEKSAALSVNISIFDDFNNSYEALVYELTKYERDIADIVVPIISVGDYALSTPQSALSVRGNIFTEITIQSQNPPDSVAQTMIKDMLKRFDEYIVDKMVTSDKVRRPNMEMSGTVPDTLMDNTKFDVKMADPSTLANIMHSENDRGTLVVRGNFDNVLFSHTFYVLERLNKTISVPTEVILTGAHVDTFHPGWKSFTFRVGQRSG